MEREERREERDGWGRRTERSLLSSSSLRCSHALLLSSPSPPPFYQNGEKLAVMTGAKPADLEKLIDENL